METYLVTGASGFIGNRLVERLRLRSDQVVVVGRRSPSDEGPTFRCDLTKGPIPSQAFRGVGGVFHLAGIAHTDAASIGSAAYREVNVVATERLLGAAVKAGCKRFVYISSVQAVDNGGSGPWTESDGVAANSIYGHSKYDAEQVVNRFSDRIETCILRPTLVYGPHVKGNLRQMLAQIHKRRFPPIPEFGAKRSMVSVDDLVSAAILAMEADQSAGKTYIIADGRDYTARELYESISRAFGHSIPSWRLPEFFFRSGAAVGDLLQALGLQFPLSSSVMEKLSGNARYSAEQIKADLGWEPRYSFHDQVGQIVAAYLEEVGA